MVILLDAERYPGIARELARRDALLFIKRSSRRWPGAVAKFERTLERGHVLVRIGYDGHAIEIADLADTAVRRLTFGPEAA